MRLFLLYLCFALVPVSADWHKVLAISPQKTWQIQCQQVGNLAGGDPQAIDFVDLKSGKVAFSFASVRRSTDAGWSPDGASAVVNDRTATSGDFLYLFRVIDHHIILVRAPGDDEVKSSLLKAYQQLKSTGRFTLTGRQWLTNSTLLVRVTGGGYGDDQAFEAIVHIDDSGRATLDKNSVKPVTKV